MKVNTEQLYQQGDQLRRVLNQVLDIQDEIGRVTAVLRTETVGEKFVPALLDARRETESRGRELDQLWRALHEIARCYEECENKVVEATEFSVYSGLAAEQALINLGTEEMPTLDWTPWEP